MGETVTLEMTPVRQPETVVWMTPADGLWVAHSAGEYLGMVETTGTGYAASDERGAEVGVFGDLTSAKTALEPGSELNIQVHEDRRERLMRIINMSAIAASVAGMAAVIGMVTP